MIHIEPAPPRPPRPRSDPQPPRKRKPRRRFPVEVLDPDEVGRLIAACGQHDGLGMRNQALLAVLYRSGLRIAEALGLYPKDVDLAAGTIRVLCGKGGKARTVGIDPGAAKLVRRWLDRRASLALDGRHRLFCTLAGKKLSTGYLRRLLPNLGRKARIEKRVHAHGLRHTMAAELRAEGVDIAIISRQLGHASITTTARYLDHLAPMAVIEAMSKRKWGSSESGPQKKLLHRSG